MLHKHKATGLEFEVGDLVDNNDGKTYDITVITKWTDPESDKLPPVKLINYYFGGYDKDDTDFYIDKALENIEKLKRVEHYLKAYHLTNEDVLEDKYKSELKELIDFVKTLSDLS